MRFHSALFLLPWFAVGCAERPQPEAVRSPDQGIVSNPSSGPVTRVNVGNQYAASDWMGDGEQGTKYLEFSDASRAAPHAAPVCMKFSYKPGPKGWAGVYWLNEPKNWGEQPGVNFSGRHFTKVSFWVRGETGQEVVRFKAGGVRDKRFKDSFTVSSQDVTLPPHWTQYSLDISRVDLSSVIGLFSWTANERSNPNGIVFYLEDIEYE